MEETLGQVIFSANVTECFVHKVKEAAILAGIPEDFVKEIKPRSMFLRAMDELAKQGILATGADGNLRHKLLDNNDKIEFQLTRWYVEQHNVRYDPQVKVTFHKQTSLLTCEMANIQELAQALFQKAGQVFRSYDLHNLCRRFLEKSGCRQIMLRDGVYFIPDQFSSQAEQVKVFFQHLGFASYVLPVGHDSRDKESVIKAVVADITKTVNALKSEVLRLKSDNNLTPKIAGNRISELRTSLKQYQEIAKSLNVSLLDIFNDAGEAGHIIETIGRTTEQDLISALRSQNGFVRELITAHVPFEAVIMENQKQSHVLVDVEAGSEGELFDVARKG